MCEARPLAHLLFTARQIDSGISNLMHQSQEVLFRIHTNAHTHIQVYAWLCVAMCVRETEKQRQRARGVKKERDTQTGKER